MLEMVLEAAEPGPLRFTRVADDDWHIFMGVWGGVLWWMVDGCGTTGVSVGFWGLGGAYVCVDTYRDSGWKIVRKFGGEEGDVMSLRWRRTLRGFEVV